MRGNWKSWLQMAEAGDTNRRHRSVLWWMATILLSLLLGGAWFAGTGIRVSAQEKTNLYLFHNNPCESCHEDQKLLDMVHDNLPEDVDSGDIQTWVYYAYETSNNEKMKELCAQGDVDPGTVTYPLMAVQGRIYCGTQAIEEGVRQLKIEETAGAVQGKTDETGGYSSGSYRFTRTNRVLLRYFKTQSCASCEKAFDYLSKLPDTVQIGDTSYPVVLEIVNVAEADGAEELMKLSDFYAVTPERQKVPIVFLGKTALSGEREITGQVRQLLEEEDSLYEAVREEGDGTAAEESAASDFGYLKAGSIFLAGFVNGFNPCSLSMTLLFLSLLSSGFERRRFRLAGISFLAGKYLAYLGIGLLLAQAFASLPFDSFTVLRKTLSCVLIGLCVLLAAGNFMDYYHIRKGDYGKIRLQLPSFLRKADQNLLKAAVRPGFGKWLIVVVFGASCILAVGEFLCTGQIYLAVILSFLRQEPEGTLPLLFFVLYVTALCLPAAVLFLLVDRGKGVLSLSGKSLGAMPYIKLASGILFVVVALFAVFSM